MAWTAPSGHTWTDGVAETAASFNTYISNNLTFIATSWMCRMIQNATQAIAQGAAANFNAKSSDDPQSMISGSTTSCIFTVPSSSIVPTTTRWQYGWATLFGNPGATGSQNMRNEIRKNPSGANTLISASTGAGGGGAGGQVVISGVDYASLTNADVLQLRINNVDATHGTITTTSDSSGVADYFWVRLVGFS